MNSSITLTLKSRQVQGRIPLVVVVFMVTLALAGCERKMPPQPSETIPLSLRRPSGHRNARWSDGEREIIVFEDNFKLRPENETWLFIVDGGFKDDSYQATSLQVGRLEDADWVLTPCQGSATVTKDGVHIEVSGSKECEAYRGHYRHPVPKEVRDQPPTGKSPCARYTACICALERHWTAEKKPGENPFTKGCRDAQDLLSSAKNDLDACNLGLSMSRSAGKTFGLSPNECHGTSHVPFEDAETKAAVSGDLPFTFDIPKGWERDDPPPGSISKLFASDGKAIVGTVMDDNFVAFLSAQSIPCFGKPSASTAGKLTAQLKKEHIQAGAKATSLVEHTLIDIDKRKAVRLVFDVTFRPFTADQQDLPKIPVRQVVYYVTDGTRCASLIYNAPKRDWSKYEPAITKSALSLKWGTARH